MIIDWLAVFAFVVIGAILYFVIGLVVASVIDLRLFDDKLSWADERAMMVYWPLHIADFGRAVFKSGAKSYWSRSRDVHYKIVDR
jgi:hypothetical protein